MPSKFVVGLRACSVAAILALTVAEAAEPKPASLMGATREQVLARLGEPRSNIVAGTREVLLFERERVVLRNNVVVEVDLIPVEPAPRPAPLPSEPADVAEEKSSSNDVVVEKPAPPSQPSPVSAADAPLEIRSVRRAGASAPRLPPKSEPAPAAPTTTSPSSNAPQQTTSSAPASAPATPGTAVVATAPASPPALATSAAIPETDVLPSKTVGDAAGETADPAKAETIAAEAAPAPKAVAPKTAARPRHEPALETEEPSVFTLRSYGIAFLIVAGGIGYIMWRSRQRKLELAATAVSRTPFAAPVAVAAGARFTADLLSKLEWKRFEQLVAAYYGKTGVVATRTNTPPSSPVHIKISWKGESRPFAFVQCIAHPVGLVDAKPIQELVASMEEDIRRAYVVTTGKFNVSARDFAEEKHVTLLSGDILLEKLNALPDGARNELMQEITTGDYSTPSCPICGAKMNRSPDEPPVWRCAAHPEAVIAAWK